MNTLRLQPRFLHSNLHNPTTNFPRIIPIKPNSKLENRSASLSSSSSSLVNPKRGRKTDKSLNLQISPLKSKIFSTEKYAEVLSKGHSRIILLGAISLGFAVLLMDDKAFALGPEGPLMEEFWDNMRRYGLYALTVSTGALYTLLKPIVELLKNPISAILILTIIGGGIFIVSQVVTAMVGLTDFSYDYSY